MTPAERRKIERRVERVIAREMRRELRVKKAQWEAAAFARGEAAARAEFDAMLARFHRLKELNGSGDLFKAQWDESRRDRLPGGKADAVPDSALPPGALREGAAHEREHTSDPGLAKEIAKDHVAEDPDYYDKLAAVEGDPHAALLDALLQVREEMDGDPDLPAALEYLRGRIADEDGETVGKAWSEGDHPRGKNGRFIGKDRLKEAQTNPAVADELRKEVKPEDAGKLERVISGETDPGRTKQGQARHDASQRKQARAETRARADAVISRLHNEAYKNLTADDLHALCDHLPDMTVEQVRRARLALHANNLEAGFGGARRKAEMVANLVAGAKAHAAGMADPLATEQDATLHLDAPDPLATERLPESPAAAGNLVAGEAKPAAEKTSEAPQPAPAPSPPEPAPGQDATLPPAPAGFGGVRAVLGGATGRGKEILAAAVGNVTRYRTGDEAHLDDFALARQLALAEKGEASRGATDADLAPLRQAMAALGMEKTANGYRVPHPNGGHYAVPVGSPAPPPGQDATLHLEPAGPAPRRAKVKPAPAPAAGQSGESLSTALDSGRGTSDTTPVEPPKSGGGTQGGGTMGVADKLSALTNFAASAAKPAGALYDGYRWDAPASIRRVIEGMGSPEWAAKSEAEREAELAFQLRYVHKYASPAERVTLRGAFAAAGLTPPPTGDERRAVEQAIRAAGYAAHSDDDAVYVKIEDPKTGNRVLAPVTDYTPDGAAAAVKQAAAEMKRRQKETRARVRAEKEVNRE